MILMNLYDCFGCLLNTPCINFNVWSPCRIRKTIWSHWVFFNTTINSFYFRSNVPESTSHGPAKNHDVLQERVDAEESAKHQCGQNRRARQHKFCGKRNQRNFRYFQRNFTSFDLLSWEKIIRRLKILFFNKYCFLRKLQLARGFPHSKLYEKQIVIALGMWVESKNMFFHSNILTSLMFSFQLTYFVALFDFS